MIKQGGGAVKGIFFFFLKIKRKEDYVNYEVVQLGKWGINEVSAENICRRHAWIPKGEIHVITLPWPRKWKIGPGLLAQGRYIKYQVVIHKPSCHKIE